VENGLIMDVGAVSLPMPSVVHRPGSLLGLAAGAFAVSLAVIVAVCPEWRVF
jgi:hypothetical protein